MKPELVIENGKIVKVTINGKPVKAGFMRALQKAQETNFWTLLVTDQICFNPISGAECKLDYFEASIYNWCTRWYRMYERMAAPTSIQVFDNMKYLLLSINRQAYMDLFD